jgi:hypothetical protein
VELPDDDLLTLSTWITKTALVFDRAQPLEVASRF